MSRYQTLVFATLLLAAVSAASRVFLVHLHPPVPSRQIPFSSRSSASDRRETLRQVFSHSVRDVQSVVTRFIEAQNQEFINIHSLWIQNTLVAEINRSNELQNRFFTQELQYFPGVLNVEEDAAVLQLIPSEREELLQKEEVSPQSNIKLLHAPQLWATGVTGRGVVVANIDSGVRYTHEALRENFRGTKNDGKVDFDYSFWFTPGTDMAKESPDTADVVGHGTHTMGTAVGSKGVGVAPDATWIAARAFDERGAANKSDFLLAAQWVLCPTRMDGTGENCSLGADVVTNSYGVDRSTSEYPAWTWLSMVIDTWRAAGVYPVFASGNTNGFLCGSVYYPGSRENTIAVGALMGGKSLWGASGKGPGLDDVLSPSWEEFQGAGSKYVIKPDFVAPGFAIRSALSGGDTLYTRFTGTSMATPHMAGAIALLLSLHDISDHNLLLNRPPMEKVLESLAKTTTRDLRKPFLVPSECGNTTYREYPNNIYGWGLANVCLAAKHLGSPCVDSNFDDPAVERTSPFTISDVAATE